MFEGMKHYVHDNEYCYAICDQYRIDFISTQDGLNIAQTNGNHHTSTTYTLYHNYYYECRL